MWAFLLAVLDRFIRNEPGVPAAAFVSPARVRPPSNVALVLIGNTEREAIDIDLSIARKMENVFVAVIEESFRADWLEMAERPVFDGDRLDPVDRVLQNEEIPKLKNDFVRQHWV